MKEIVFSDFKNSVFSIKSLFVFIFFCLISYVIGQNYDTLGKVNQSSVISTVYGAIETFGVLFGFMLFSGIVSKMVENESVRYITPYVSRVKIIVAKYLAVLIYFLFLLLLMLPVAMFSSKVVYLPIKEFGQAFLFFAYISSIILLLSVITKNERKSTFIGIFIGILIPVIGAVSVLSENIAITGLSWVLPYRYETLNLESFVLVILTGVIFSIAILLFQKMEL